MVVVPRTMPHVKIQLKMAMKIKAISKKLSLRKDISIKTRRNITGQEAKAMSEWDLERNSQCSQKSECISALLKRQPELVTNWWRKLRANLLLMFAFSYEIKVFLWMLFQVLETAVEVSDRSKATLWLAIALRLLLKALFFGFVLG